MVSRSLSIVVKLCGSDPGDVDEEAMASDFTTYMLAGMRTAFSQRRFVSSLPCKKLEPV